MFDSGFIKNNVLREIQNIKLSTTNMILTFAQYPKCKGIMKNLCLILILLLSTVHISKAQNLLIAQNIYMDKLTVDADKNIIISGHFSGTFDFDFSANKVELTSWSDGNGTEFFVASYDSLLNYNWVFSLGRGSSEIYSILTDDSCNIYVNGYGFSTTDFDLSISNVFLNPRDGEYPFFAKYGKDGSFKWVKNRDIKMFKELNNSFYGYTYSTINKFDHEGNEIWNTNVPIHSNLIFDKKSKFYYLTDSTGNRYFPRPLTICAIDTLGIITMNKNMSESTNCLFEMGKLFLINDNILISGSYWGGNVDMDPNQTTYFLNDTTTYALFQHGQYTGIRLPEFKSFIAEYDLDGNLIFASDRSQLPSSYESDDFGNIFSLGSFTDSINLSFKDEDISISTVESALYIAKYDSEFNFLSATKLTEMTDSQYRVATPYINNFYLRDNYAILSGRFNNVFLKQDEQLFPHYPAFYIAVYDNFDLPSLITNQTEISKSLIKIYPNPVFNTVNIEVPQFINYAVLKIYNINGKEIIRNEMQSSSTQIDMSNLNSGIYMLKIFTNNQEIVCKIVKK